MIVVTTRQQQFVPLWGIPVYLLYVMRRVDCPDCGVKVERIPWADGKHRSTYSYRIFLANWARRLSWKETAAVFATSWDTVFRAVDWVVRWCLLKRPENLTTKQTVKLSELMQHNLRSVKAYLMREDFQRFWEYERASWAGKFLDQWCKRAMRSRIKPPHQFTGR
ncbi:transposase [Stieleria sp. TO1_6]|nr:transposase [Stieleria tagensis]